LKQVAETLLTLPQRALSAVRQVALPPYPDAVMRVREAALASDEWVPLMKAKGRVSARCAGAYPPGVPMIVPGERVTGEVVEALLRTKQRFGVENGGLRCVAC